MNRLVDTFNRMTTCALPALTMFRRGTKSPLTDVMAAIKLRSSHRYSAVRTAARNNWVVSQGVRHGTFGNIRLCAGKDPEQKLVAKEFRSGAAARAKPHAKTCPNSEAGAVCELVAQQVVEPDLRVYDTANVFNKTAEYDGKLLAIMDWMPGDGDMLARIAAKSEFKPILGRMMAVDMLKSLKRCHQAGYIHHDVKLANILWNAEGRFFLSDFGKAREMSDGRVKGGMGTWFAPEQLAENPDEKGNIRAPESYDASIDFWGLGMTLLTFHAPWYENPIVRANCLLTDPGLTPQQRLAGINAVFKSFKAFRETLLDDDGSIAMERINAPGTPQPEDGMDWHTTFATAAAADASLVLALLSYMIVPEANDRGDIDEMIACMEAGLPEAGSELDVGARAAMAKFAEPTPETTAHFKNMAALHKAYYKE